MAASVHIFKFQHFSKERQFEMLALAMFYPWYRFSLLPDEKIVQECDATMPDKRADARLKKIPTPNTSKIKSSAIEMEEDIFTNPSTL